MEEEEEPLLAVGPGPPQQRPTPRQYDPPMAHQLSVIFAITCIVDQFGIVPVITLPRSIIECGWIGFPLSLSVFALSIYTSMLLGRCWVISEALDPTIASKSRYPYTAMVNLVWGDKASKYANWFLNTSIFTSNIPALVIASQNLQSLDVRISGSRYSLSYCYWLIILGAVSSVITWLGSPKDLKWVSLISSCSVLLGSVLTWLCMIGDDTSEFSYREMPRVTWHRVAVAYGNLAFQLTCHPVILAVQVDMDNKRDLSRGVFGSFIVTGSLILTSSLLAVSFYGAGTKANITDGLPNSLLLFIALSIIILQLVFSTLIGGCPLFQDIEEKLGVPKVFCWQRCIIRSGIVMAAVLLAEMLPKFDLVMGILGGLFSGPICFIMPAVLYYKLRSMLPPPQEDMHTSLPMKSFSCADSMHSVHRFLQKNFLSLDINVEGEGPINALEMMIAVLIVLLGVCATVVATYFSVLGALWSVHFVPPCIFNVAAASNHVAGID